MTTAVITYQKKPKPDPINNTVLVADFKADGGRVLHVRGEKGRGVTFAFRARKNRVEFATALTHTSDTFTRKVGTRTAITHFTDGQTVFLPLPAGVKATDFLQYVGELALQKGMM